MYEVNRRRKDLEEIVERTKLALDDEDLSGLMVIRVSKDGQALVDAVFGSASEYEWVGIVDYAKDLVKNQYAIAAEEDGEI